MIIAVKKKPEKKNQGFNGIRIRDLRDTGAMFYQLSYEATHWERGQYFEFISPVRSERLNINGRDFSICTYVWIYENGAGEFESYHPYFTLTSLLLNAVIKPRKRRKIEKGR